jgi:hypothetical protein
LRAPNWVNRVRVCLLRKYVSLSAMIFLLLYLCTLKAVLGGMLLVPNSLLFLVLVELWQLRCAKSWGGIRFLHNRRLGNGKETG